MSDLYLAVASIDLINYPLDNPEYAGGPFGEDYVGPPRFPPVYEFLDENWKIKLEYKVYDVQINEQGEITIGAIATGAESFITSVNASAPDFRSVTLNIDNSITPTKKFAVVTIQGTYTDIFDQKRYDFRMKDESLLEDADVVKIGDDYYAPYNYVPDFRVFLENTFSIRGNWEVLSQKGAIVDSYTHTVLNNWEANRRRLLLFRDNIKRGEQVERNEFGGVANSPDETFNDPNVPNPITTIR